MIKKIFLKKYSIYIFALILYAVLVSFFYYQTQQYAIEKATEKIEEVLLNTKALRKYVSIQKNEIYRLQEQNELNKEYFSPILLSSTYISKQVNNIYNYLRENEDKDAITIRFASDNPRNDANKASAKEEELLKRFNQNKTLTSYKELIKTDKTKAIYYATPTRVTTGDCAICHSDPAIAPKGLVQMYGDTKGFYEHQGNIRAILSTTYPIQKELKDAQFFFYILSFATFLALSLMIFILSKYINIIKDKQQLLSNLNKELEQKVKAQTKEIVSQHNYLDLILNSSPNHVLVSDINSLIYANDAFFKTFQSYISIKDFNEKIDFKSFVFDHYCDKKSCDIDAGAVKSLTNKQWLKLFANKNVKLCFYQKGQMNFYTMSTTKIEKQKQEHYLHIITNITELEEVKLKLEELSLKDELTKLYNRRHFNHIYFQQQNEAMQKNCYFVFAIFDIDYFKNYNDTLGHLEGDNALIKVSKAIKKHFSRSGDFCFRMGGEEFGIITTTDSKDLIKQHIIQFHNAINDLQIPHPNSKVAKHLTLSIGVYIAKVESKKSIDFYKEADALLYKAKESRNSVVFNF